MEERDLKFRWLNDVSLCFFRLCIRKIHRPSRSTDRDRSSTRKSNNGSTSFLRVDNQPGSQPTWNKKNVEKELLFQLVKNQGIWKEDA